MSNGEVADAQLVQSAQSTQTAVNRMSTFYPNQTRCLVLFKGVQYICNNIFILFYIKNINYFKYTYSLTLYQSHNNSRVLFEYGVDGWFLQCL